LWCATAVDQLCVTNDGFLAGLLGEAHESSVVAVLCGALTAECEIPQRLRTGVFHRSGLSLQE
jgi:hypothetical protein